MVGVIGPNGSGKSTLIDLMLGLREPASGNIRAAGFTLGEIGAERWHALVGFVPQSILCAADDGGRKRGLRCP